mmetsp:Transcript_97861/g.204049  ORF Transcript_97861/g.204049 Transcript_97861/m.204049 type:complete len:592 (-) Transcript_97861:108-1883(-)
MAQLDGGNSAFSWLSFAEGVNESLSPFPDPEFCSMSQIIFLTCMYCYVLFQAANLLSDGSELLLLVPSLAPIVGSVVLPVLGAVPDGMMVLFSGMGPDAQNQVSVGVGALAGSTIMLLTLPWFLAVFAGRVTLKDGVPTYKRPPSADRDTWEKLDHKTAWNPFRTGVGYDNSIKKAAKMMIGTTVGYFIIQGAAFTVDSQAQHPSRKDQKHEAKTEHIFSLIGLIICTLEFLWYLKICWTDSRGGQLDDQIANANVQAMREGKLTLRGVMVAFRERNWSFFCKGGDLEAALLDKESLDEVRRMCKVLAPFFAHYDINGDNKIDFEEFRMIFKDVNESLSREAQAQMFQSADVDQSGFISFEEFVACLMSFSLSNELVEPKRRYVTNPQKYIDSAADGQLSDREGNSDDEEEGEEEEDIPDDLANLEPEEQQKRIKYRAFSKMAAGLGLVLVFSDPTVDLLSEIGKRLDISPFYISFILAPMASNASELVAAYNYAAKCTTKSMTTSLSTLEGAAIMNNTFCLGIFLALVYFKKLAWEFSAETLVIIVIQWIIGASVVFKNTQTLARGFSILCLYPLALVFVYILENKVGLD